MFIGLIYNPPCEVPADSKKIVINTVDKIIEYIFANAMSSPVCETAGGRKDN